MGISDTDQDAIGLKATDTKRDTNRARKERTATKNRNRSIMRLHLLGCSIGDIATKVGHAYNTVRKVIKTHESSRTYYYARVSSKEQNLDRQIAAFKALGAAEREIITDKESVKDLARVGYQALKNAMLRRGDTLVIKSLDRLSRNKADIRNELQYFKDNGIRLNVIDLPTTMMELPEGQEWVFEMVNNILIEVLGTIAEQERITIRQRQAEGIVAAKQNGKRFGRPSLTVPANWTEVYQNWEGGKITARRNPRLDVGLRVSR